MIYSTLARSKYDAGVISISKRTNGWWGGRISYTYSRLWGWYWPNWSFGRAACEQLIWADAMYPSDYVAFHLFTWTQHPHWTHTDFSGIENPAMFELHDCLETYAHSLN